MIIVSGVIILFAAFSTYSTPVSGAEKKPGNVASYQAELVKEQPSEPMKTAGIWHQFLPVLKVQATLSSETSSS